MTGFIFPFFFSTLFFFADFLAFSGNENPEDLEELIDVDIWAEKTSQQSSNSPVTQGTLNFLIQTLTSHHDYDLNFLKTFIYTYQSFTTPTQLFHKFTRRFDVPDHEKQHAEAIQLRVCVVLKYWIQVFQLSQHLLLFPSLIS